MKNMADLLAQADRVAQEGKWDEAEGLLEEVLQLAPGHELAMKKLHDVQDKKAQDAEVRALIASARDLARSHQYEQAIECYDHAQVTGALAGILSYHAQCERERDACRERLAWQGRVQDACQKAKSDMQHENWPAALATVDAVLADLQATDYGDLAGELENLRAEITTNMGNEALLQQAEEAWKRRSYARAIELAQQVLDSDPRPVQRHKAEGIIRDNREMLELIRPTVEEAQKAYDDGRLDDAAALLSDLQGFSENPTWRGMWLKVHMDRGRQLLDAGRQYNVEGDFERATHAFGQARVSCQRILDLYDNHAGAVGLDTEARELHEIAGLERQAQTDWDSGRRGAARGALQAARGVIDRAEVEDRTYSAVSAKVTAMLVALDQEILLIEEQAEILADARRLLENRNLEAAQQRFRAILNALDPETAQASKQGLNTCEAQIEIFAGHVRHAEESDSLPDRVDALQAAYDCWPEGRGVRRRLVVALVEAAEAACERSEDERATDYATRAIALDEDSRRAQRVLLRVEQGPGVRRILAQVRKDLQALEASEEWQPDDYTPFLSQLAHAESMAGEMEELRAPVTALAGEIRDRQQSLRDYQLYAQQAETLRQQGEWQDAAATLAKALAAAGSLPLPAPRERLVAWQQVAEAITSQEAESDAALAAAQEAYDSLLEPEGPGRYNFAAPLSQLQRAETAIELAEGAAGGILSPGLKRIQRQAGDLRQRTVEAQTCWELSSSDEGLDEAVRRLRVACQSRPGDAILQGLRDELEARLEEVKEGLIERLQREADRALAAGDINAALEALQKIVGMGGDTPEVRAELQRVEGVVQRESRLQTLWNQYEENLRSDSRVDALDALQESIEILSDPGAQVPEEVQESTRELLEQRPVLGQENGWHAAQRLQRAIIEASRKDPRTLGRLADQTRLWLELGRRVGLLVEIRSLAHLGELENAYEAAVAAVRTSQEEEFLRELGEAAANLLQSVDGSAIKRLGRARNYLDKGDYVSAVKDLESIEVEFYLPLEERFPNLLRDHEEAEKIREEALELVGEARHLEEVAGRIQPLLQQTREAQGLREFDKAAALLEQIELEDPGHEAVALHREAEGLRQAVDRLQASWAGQRLDELLVEADTRLALAPDRADYEAVLDLLKGISPKGLNQAQQFRWKEMIDQARNAMRDFEEGRDWLARGEAALEVGDYETAVDWLERAYKASRTNRVPIQVKLDEARKKRDLARRQEELLAAGRQLLAQQDYYPARQRLSEAKTLGAEVEPYLQAARAGVMLSNGRESYEKGDYDLAALDLDEAIRLVEGMEEASSVLDEAQQYKARLQQRLEQRARVQQTLGEARRLVAGGSYADAQARVQQLLDDEPGNTDALGLLEEIEKRQRDHAKFELALAALEGERFDEAKDLVDEILGQAGDYAPAVALRSRIAREREPAEALDRALGLARTAEFRKAQIEVEKAIHLKPDHPRIPEVRQTIEDLHKEWEDEALQPINEAFRAEQFPEALTACEQALERGGTPEFISEVKYLQQRTVETWAETSLAKASRMLDEATTTDALETVAKRAQEVQKIEPEPPARLLSEARDLWRRATEMRLRQRRDQAVARSDEQDFEAALDLLGDAEADAKELGLGQVTHEIKDARRMVERRQAESRKRQRDERLEEATHALEAAGTLVALRQALRLAENVRSPLYDEDDQAARALETKIHAEIELFQTTQQALDEARRHQKRERFRPAMNALTRLDRVSRPLQEEYEQTRALTELLVQAEEAQDGRNWGLAYDSYQKAIEMDPALANSLERNQRRCRDRLLEALQDDVEEHLRSIPPNPERVKELLASGEKRNLVSAAHQRTWDRLRAQASSLEPVLEAIEILEAGQPPEDALAALDRARQLAPQDAIHPTIPNWEHLARGLQALYAGKLEGARRELAMLEPPVADHPLAGRLRERLGAAEEQERTVQQMLQQIRSALLAHPARIEEAVLAAHKLHHDVAPQDPRSIQAYDRLRDRLELDLESARQSGDYARALEAGDRLLQLVPDDDELQRDVKGLPEEREGRLAETLAAAWARLREDALVAARDNVRLAGRIAAPEGDERVTEVLAAIDDRSRGLRQVDEAVDQAQQRLAAEDLATLSEAVALAQDAERQAEHYQAVDELRAQILERLSRLTRLRLRDERFDEALAYVDLALRLEPDPGLTNLRKEVIDTRLKRTDEILSQARQARAIYDVAGAQRLVERGLRVAPDHPDLVDLGKELQHLDQVVVRPVAEAVLAGWEEIKDNRFDQARGSFRRAVRNAPDFAEARRWYEYAENVDEGIRLVLADDYDLAVERFRAARSQLMMEPGERLTPLLCDPATLHDERRQAAFEAQRLMDEAREMDALWQRVSNLRSGGQLEESYQELQVLQDRVAKFGDFVRTSVSAPRDFDLGAARPREERAAQPRSQATGLEQPSVKAKRTRPPVEVDGGTNQSRTASGAAASDRHSEPLLEPQAWGEPVHAQNAGEHPDEERVAPKGESWLEPQEAQAAPAESFGPEASIPAPADDAPEASLEPAELAPELPPVAREEAGVEPEVSQPGGEAGEQAPESRDELSKPLDDAMYWPDEEAQTPPAEQPEQVPWQARPPDSEPAGTWDDGTRREDEESGPIWSEQPEEPPWPSSETDSEAGWQGEYDPLPGDELLEPAAQDIPLHDSPQREPQQRDEVAVQAPEAEPAAGREGEPEDLEPAQDDTVVLPHDVLMQGFGSFAFSSRPDGGDSEDE